MISQDLGGRRKTSYRAVDDGGPMSTAELLMRPISLFLIACTAFVIVLMVWLWQAGVFGQFQFSLTPSQPVPSSSWIGGRRARSVQPIDETGRPPAPGPSADAGSASDDAAASPEDTADSNAAN